jgi:hypothetical protein
MVITRGLAWFGILAIVILSVVPADVRPTTGAAPGFEHLAAFGLVAGVFAISYRQSLGRLLLMAFLYCGGIELLQVPLPTRHARPPPWIVEEHNNACFIVKDATGQALGYFYFEEEPGRRSAAKLLTKDKARRVAANFAARSCC